jgi:hypothetical protein
VSRTSRRGSLQGAAKPRVECVPPSAYSLGDEAVELARRAGLVLDPWQADSIRLMLSVREDGKWACFEYGEIVARQNGKGAILECRALAGLFLLDERSSCGAPTSTRPPWRVQALQGADEGPGRAAVGEPDRRRRRPHQGHQHQR